MFSEVDVYSHLQFLEQERKKEWGEMESSLSTGFKYDKDYKSTRDGKA